MVTARFAVVSGGGTGIGAATALALAQEGYDVLITGRRADVLTATATRIGTECGRPDAIQAVTADLTVPADVDRLAGTFAGRTVDVVVNNAGGFFGGDTSTSAGRAAHWHATLDSNVLSAVLLTEAVRPALRRPGGRVILISSIAALRGGGGAYSAAKAALHGWAYALAAELGPEQITVNVVSPGYIADTEFFDGRMTPEGHASRVAATLVGRAGESADVASAIRYLASPEASFVTGQVLGVNGGSVFGR